MFSPPAVPLVHPFDLTHMTFRQNLVLGVTTATLLAAILSYALRLFAKRITAAHVWWDDYMIGIGLLFATIPCICNYVGLTYGFGLHADTLPPNYPRNYLICLYTLLIGWMISQTIIKFGILLFYWRTFPGKYFRWSIWTVALFVTGCFFAGFLGFCIQCIPINGFWDPIPHPKCMNEMDFFVATATLGLVGDVIILIQPLPIILGLKTSRQKRFGLCVVFLTGGVVVFISAFRLASLQFIDSKDITWSNTTPGLWTSSEVTIGVVSANLPFMRPLLGAAWTKVRLSRHNSPDTSRTRHENASEDRHMLQRNGFARMSPNSRYDDGLGCTSMVRHDPDDRGREDVELGIRTLGQGIYVRTDVELRIERSRNETLGDRESDSSCDGGKEFKV